MIRGKRHKFRFPDRIDPHALPSIRAKVVEDGKLYVDPVYGEDRLTKLTVNGITLKGKWEAEVDDIGEFDYVLRLVDQMSSSAVVFTFTCAEDRLQFIRAMESNRDIPYVDSYHQSFEMQPFLESPRKRRKVAVVGGAVAGAVGVLGLLAFWWNKRQRQSSDLHTKV